MGSRRFTSNGFDDSFPVQYLTYDMVSTNQFVEIAFAMVTNFTQQVDMPKEWVPKSVSDVSHPQVFYASKMVQGGLQCRGCVYYIGFGVVQGFRLLDSFGILQDPALIDSYAADAVISSNQAVALASKMLERIAKVPNVLSGTFLKVTGPTTANYGKIVPYYFMTWYRTNHLDPQHPELSPTVADVEIDAGKAIVASLNVYDIGFRDDEMGKEINRRVYTAEPLPQRPPINRKLMPMPTSDDARVVLKTMQDFCGKIGIKPDPDMDESHINWDRSFWNDVADGTKTNMWCQIVFKNGGTCITKAGQPLTFARGDACFAGDREQRSEEEWKRFGGTQNKTWEECAASFLATLKKAFPRKAALVDQLRGEKYIGGTEELRYCSVIFRTLKQWEMGDLNGVVPAMLVEFDLADGSIKAYRFTDLSIIGKVY
ncbi:MAG TPA: hypothetical protein VMF06_25295 [Candidatus Limnocylindria bacterium]|jgi:hypothetical protein|nr:hypothetical protein [Candidatus Limnocylindria bacterium]